MRFEPVTHVLFDMDGLILNTEELYTVAFQNITSKYGKDFTFELKTRLMGRQALEVAKIIVMELDLPITLEEFLAESTKQFENLFPNTDIMPGAKKLIEHFHRHKVPIALATSSSEASYKLKTQRHQDLFSLFDVKVFGSSDPDVVMGKPAPDIFLVAASRFPDKPAPNKCLVLEDAINGVKAARIANMQVVMVPDPRLDIALTKEATLVLSSLELFKPELFGVKRLIEHLHQHNVPMGLATSSSIESYTLKTRHHSELFDLLKYKTWGSSDPNVKKGKPYPDIFLVAASKFPEKPKPEQCLVFEDSINGVLAARAAGMQAVMVPDPRLDRALAADATLVLNSVEEFRPELFGLPPYSD